MHLARPSFRPPISAYKKFKRIQLQKFCLSISTVAPPWSPPLILLPCRVSAKGREEPTFCAIRVTYLATFCSIRVTCLATLILFDALLPRSGAYIYPPHKVPPSGNHPGMLSPCGPLPKGKKHYLTRILIRHTKSEQCVKYLASAGALISPHQDTPADFLEEACSGVVECSVTATSAADRALKHGLQIDDRL